MSQCHPGQGNSKGRRGSQRGLRKGKRSGSGTAKGPEDDAPAQSMLGSSPSPAPEQSPQGMTFSAIILQKQKRASADALKHSLCLSLSNSLPP